MGSVIKKRRKKMRKHKHKKMLKKTRWQRRRLAAVLVSSASMRSGAPQPAVETRHGEDVRGTAGLRTLKQEFASSNAMTMRAQARAYECSPAIQRLTA